MSWLDLIILIALIWAGWHGWSRGLVGTLAYWVGGAVAIALALSYAPEMGSLLVRELGVSPGLARALAVAGLFVGLLLLLRQLIKIWHWVIGHTALRPLDHLAGLGMGLSVGILIVSLLLGLMTALPVEMVQVQLHQSALALEVLRWTPRMTAVLRQWLPQEWEWEPGKWPRSSGEEGA